MKNKSTLLILGLSFLLSIFGTTAKQGDKSLQGSFNNPSKLSLIYNVQLKGTGGERIIRTSDGGSLISSYLDRTHRVITKLSSDGSSEWEQTLGKDYIIEINDLVEIPDVGYEAIGYLYLTNYDFNNANCRYIVRFNYKGEITNSWPARIKDKNALKSCNNQITRCSDGTYVTMYDLYHQSKSLVPYFWRYDTDGNLIDEVIHDTLSWATFYVGSLLQRPDGGFGALVMGRDSNGNGGLMQIWRLDKTGKKIWSKDVGSWNSILYATYSSAILTADGGFAVVALNNLPENDTAYTILRKYDMNGNVVFTKKYALNLWNAPTQIAESSLGNIFIGGFTQNNDTYHLDPKVSDYFVIKTMSNGELIWKDSFGDADSGDRIKAMSIVDDYTILISGYTGLLTNSSPVTTNAVTLKLTDLASAVSEQPAEPDGIHLFPNPTSTQLTLSGVEGVASVRVVNALGEEVKQFTHVSSQYSIDVSDLVSGLYFVSIRTAKGAVVKPMMVSR
ncbi:MAG: T9SS type A sorting domain-containing protein [Bacteroidetes bacterium]|nr:T9SS type A sorting domain-containing protein [Bacteroidota bacterium]